VAAASAARIRGAGRRIAAAAGVLASAVWAYILLDRTPAGCRGCAGWYWSRAWPPRAWCWRPGAGPAGDGAAVPARAAGAGGGAARPGPVAGLAGPARTRWTRWGTAPHRRDPERGAGLGRLSAAVRAAVPAARAASPVPDRRAAVGPGPGYPRDRGHPRDRGTRGIRGAVPADSAPGRAGRAAAGREHHGEQRPYQAAPAGRGQLQVGGRHRGLDGGGTARAGHWRRGHVHWRVHGTDPWPTLAVFKSS